MSWWDLEIQFILKSLSLIWDIPTFLFFCVHCIYMKSYQGTNVQPPATYDREHAHFYDNQQHHLNNDITQTKHSTEPTTRWLKLNRCMLQSFQIWNLYILIKTHLKLIKIEKALNLQWFFFNDVILNVLHTEEQFYYAYFLSLAIEHIMYRTIREAEMTM